jgi:hypothetical protein
MGLDPAARVERQIITQSRFIFNYFGTEEAHDADQAHARPSPALFRILPATQIANALAANVMGPLWYLSVTLVRRIVAAALFPAIKSNRCAGWIENYHRVKESLEEISDINRELMRRHREQNKKKKKAKA